MYNSLFFNTFQICKRLFSPHFNFSKDIHEFDTLKILRLEEVKQIEEPSFVTAGPMLGHETSYLMIRTNNKDKTKFNYTSHT